MKHDERTIRSEQARVALRIFLQRCALRLGVETLVLADTDGSTLATTDESVNAVIAARHAAALYNEGVPVPGTVERSQQAWPVQLEAGEGYLVALGTPFITSEEMEETRVGIVRILGDVD